MRTLVLAALLTSIASCGGAGEAQVPTLSQSVNEAAWSRLKADLVGTWRAEPEPSKFIEVTYRLVSNDSALVERFTSPSGRETITVYHLDNTRLLLTHYCAQLNQPRLALAQAGDGQFDFLFVDATGVRPGQSVLTKLSVKLGNGQFDQTTTYRQPNGANEQETLHFTRIAQTP